MNGQWGKGKEGENMFGHERKTPCRTSNGLNERVGNAVVNEQSRGQQNGERKIGRRKRHNRMQINHHAITGERPTRDSGKLRAVRGMPHTVNVRQRRYPGTYKATPDITKRQT